MRVRLTVTAERQIERALKWWRLYRDKAPNALAEDLAEAIELIRSQPSIGVIAASGRLRAVRRVILPRVRYHLYYAEVRAAEPTLVVVALRHESRAAGFIREEAANYDCAA